MHGYARMARRQLRSDISEQRLYQNPNPTTNSTTAVKQLWSRIIHLQGWQNSISFAIVSSSFYLLQRLTNLLREVQIEYQHVQSGRFAPIDEIVDRQHGPMAANEYHRRYVAYSSG